MNIFILDEDPVKAAREVPVKVASKMALEAAQMLAVACSVHGLNLPHKKDGGLYSPKAHINHPCTKWVCESKSNMEWVIRHGLTLCDNHAMVYDKIPAHSQAILEVASQIIGEDWCNHTPFVCVMPDDFKAENVIDSYRNYIKIKPYYENFSDIRLTS